MLADISYPPIPAIDLGPIEVSLHGVAAGVGLAVGIWLLMTGSETWQWDDTSRPGVECEGGASSITAVRLP